MREIKFRAWYQDGVSGTQMREVAEMKHSKRNGTTWYLKGGGKIPFFMGSRVMQYTGLKDKNGKEIYEGDILSWADGLYRVEYIQSYYRVELVSGDGVSHILSDDETYEVIGNIYENPELLTEDRN